jgi:hypothetical protein
VATSVQAGQSFSGARLFRAVPRCAAPRRAPTSWNQSLYNAEYLDSEQGISASS